MTSPFDFATPIGCITAPSSARIVGSDAPIGPSLLTRPFVTLSPNLGARCIMDEHEFANRVVDILRGVCAAVDAAFWPCTAICDLAVAGTPGTSMLLAVSIRRFCRRVKIDNRT